MLFSGSNQPCRCSDEQVPPALDHPGSRKSFLRTGSLVRDEHGIIGLGLWREGTRLLWRSVGGLLRVGCLCGGALGKRYEEGIADLVV